MPAVSIQNVTKRFTDVPAVDGINFDLEDGELLVLLGPSGCGKTTTLRMIAGLEEPDSGEISIGGKVVSAPDRGVFVPTERRGLGMVFQSYAVWPHMTVFDNVAYPLRVRSTPSAAINQKVRETLKLVGLDGFESRGATQLSGGQQQRVALARAMVFEPSILLLDEPLSNLDAKLRVRMRVELKRLLEQTRTTAVYVTHDQAESMALADRIIVMSNGRIEQVGGSQEIYEQPRTQFVADFVGSINLLSAKVVAHRGEPGLTSVQLVELGQTWYCHTGDETAWTEGQPVMVAVRPEKLSIHGQTPDGQLNLCQCRVEAAVYYGDRREYELSTGGPSLKASTSTNIIVAPGDSVFAAVDPQEMVLLKREE